MNSRFKILFILFCFLLFESKLSIAQCGLDIFIANDQSGSVDNVENAQGRYFITELMRNIEPWGTANNQSRIAIAQWDGSGSWQQYSFPDAGRNYTTLLSDVIAFQSSPRILSGWTNPYDALLKTYGAIQQTPVSGRIANKIIVLMTDAECSQIQNNIVRLATQIKEEGFYIIVLAIDEARNCSVLQGSNVASPGGYFNANSYEQLYRQAIDYVKSITQQACSYPPPPPPTFDLTIQLNSFIVNNCQIDGSGGNYNTNYTVRNIGDIAFNNTLKIAFYDVDPTLPVANLLAIQTLNGINIPVNGTYTGNFSSADLKTTGRLYAVVNVDGTTPPPLPNYIPNLLYIKPEKKSDNNISHEITLLRDASCKPKAIVNTAVSHTGIGCDSTITYNIELCNTGNATVMVDNFEPIAAPQFIPKDIKSELNDSYLLRLWATYYGGGMADDAKSMAVDAQGNVYIAGQTKSTSNIATSGAHQSTIGGGQDAFLVKFNSNGELQWATYYGGSLNEDVQGITVDTQDNIYITGTTESSNNIATVGAHQSFLGGYSDAFLVKFNSNGVRQWATYYGGPPNDEGFRVKVDAQDNVYMAGSANSSNDIATSGAHQITNGGVMDAFLVKFNSNGVRQWATYYGGLLHEEPTEIEVDAQDNVYMAGNANSSNNIATTGAYQNTYGGQADAFLVKFNSNGVRQWATYYGGSSFEETGGLSIDVQNNVYLSGRTTSSSNIATTGAFQSTFGGSSDAFLVKFNSNGVQQWATYYGGWASDFAFASVTDAQGNIYLGGNTYNTLGIATPGAHQSEYGGGTYDAFVVVFNTNGVRQYASYYGGSGRDEGFFIEKDAGNNIYITGKTESPNNIATTGAYQSALGGNTDAFLVKFSNASKLIIPPSTCKNYQYTYHVGNAPPGTYNYSFGFTAAAQNPGTENNPIILPDNNFNAGGFTNLNGFNGANHTTDNAVIPASLPAACVSGDKVSTAVSISSNNTCGNDFAQATVTINNTSGVDILNTVMELNLTGTGAAFAGEMYNISSNLSYQVPFVLHADYPNVPNALYTKTGKIRIPLWKLPAGTTTFNIDLSLGIPTTNLSVKIDNINTNYNAAGQSNTAALSQSVTVPANATISGFSCPTSISAGNNITFSGISTTNASSVKWASGSVANIPNTGSVGNPAIVYTPTPKDLANGFVTISLTALNSNGCETTRSCQVNINNVQYDYGDAPVTYDLNKNVRPYAGSATLHSGIYLGTIAPGAENTAKSSANATGDGNEEDGLASSSCASKPVNLQPFSLTVKATNNSNATAYLSAFIDWNNDGDYLDDGETVLDIVQAGDQSGTKDYTLQFRPQTANLTLDKYFVRLRISTDSNSVKQPYGTAPQGEVEDHVMELGSASTFNNPQSICQGSSYSINGKNYTTAGVYRDTLKNAAVGGCDSIIITNLTIKTASTFNNSQSICQGSSYSINGKNYTVAGVYRDTLKNAAVGGCDSIIITNLTIKTSSAFTNPQSICQGSSYSINGKNYTTAGTYRDTLKNAAVGGCDSIVITNLTLKTSSTFNNPQSICQGSSYSINGKNYTTAGIYRDTLKNAAVGGCDSIVITNLTLKTASTFTNSQSICQGSSYTINGKTYTTAGTYRDTLKNAAVGGCDSIVITNLTIVNQIETNLTETICSGASFIVGSQTFTTSGIYVVNLKSAGGCDSIVNLDLKVVSQVETNLTESICTGSSFTIGTQTFTTTGNYIVNMKAIGGCDSTVNLNLTVVDKLTDTVYFEICMGDSLLVGDTILRQGVHLLSFISVGGCDSIVEVNISSRSELGIQSQNIDFCDQESVELQVSPDFETYQWNDGTQSNLLVVRDTGTYWVVMEKGCYTRIDTFHVNAQACGCEVFFPQAFSPNKDGVNDVFRPIEKNITQVSLMIYNRWGERVFESVQQKVQWDGNYNGAEMPMDTYVFHYYGLCSDGAYKTHSGHVTIVR